MSLSLQHHVSLKPYNTFAIEAHAEHWLQVSDVDELKQALALAQTKQWPVLILGGGSNVLLTQDVPGLVIQMALQGRRILAEDGDQVIVEAQAGEGWHAFVCWTLDQGLAGLENLSLIPGTVGAAPVQNVGAYGVEIKDRMHSLTALDRHTGELVELSVADCAFAYRESLFKRSERWVIVAVRFVLAKHAKLSIDYGPVQQRLAQAGVLEPTAADVSRVICAIRAEKLPDPKVLGNAGSFFKNPTVSAEQMQAIKARFADLVHYPQPDGGEKLAAGWLIERAGLKGYRVGDAGVHVHQALVLVNYANASGAQMLALAAHVRASVQALFGVTLEMEPKVI